MGCGSSNNWVKTKSFDEKFNGKNRLLKDDNKSTFIAPPNEFSLYSKTYQNFEFKNKPLVETKKSNNLLLFTIQYNLSGNDFISLDKHQKDKGESHLYKDSEFNIGLIYNKGSKPNENLNKDKFYVLLDGHIEIYCWIDGHGPFGDIIAQIVQDKTFNFLNELNFSNFDNEYAKTFRCLFEEIQSDWVKEVTKSKYEYDSILSGASMTLILRKNNIIYSANVGNVWAWWFRNDKLLPSKYSIDVLTVDDSDWDNKINFSNNGINVTNKQIINDNDISSVHGSFDMIEEIRRIYENGGEIRKIAEEEKGRIFVKGKYYPAVINTRSLGDQVGGCIGVTWKPHIARYKMKRDINYFLVMCTDGISSACEPEEIVNIMKANGKIIPRGINTILAQALRYYSKGVFCPDMTLIMKEWMKYK